MKHLKFFAIIILACFSGVVLGLAQIGDTAKRLKSNPDLNGIETTSDVICPIGDYPEFPGGNDKIYNWIKRNLRYPAEAKTKHLQGSVYISFIVEVNGSLSDFKPINEVKGAPDLTKEAIRLFKTMPKWKPGKQNGKAVRMLFTMPIRFKLE